MKLGRRPSPHDRRTLHLADYLAPGPLVSPPPARHWSTRDGSPTGARITVSMFSNDRLGDCTCAAIAHHDQIAAEQTGQRSPLTSADVEQLYRGSGWNGTDHDHGTDQGWSNLEAATAARKAGWIEGFAKFDESNRNLVQYVIDVFGAAYIGADLPLSAQKQMEWDVAPAGQRDSSYDRGSWGGHAMSAVDYNHRGVRFATWGGYQFATWSWWFTYVDEGLVLLDRWWASRPMAPSGLRLEEMRADIARLSGGAA